MNRPAWTAIPAARSKLPVLQLRLLAVLSVLGLAVAAGLFSAFAWLTQEPPNVDFSVTRPRAQAQAEAVAAAWLEGRDTRFPVAEGIDPEFSDGSGIGTTVLSLTPSSWSRTSVTGRPVESHSFVAETTAGTYRLSLVFTLDGPSPTLAAYPVLTPYNGAGAGSEPLDYRSVPALVDRVPAPVRDRVERWALAYGADNGTALRDLADDRTATARQYRGLGGLRPTRDPQIVTAVSTADGLVLRVRVDYQPSGATGALTMDFDLLVTGASGQTPRVVAWGPPGTGPTLQRYQNRSS